MTPKEKAKELFDKYVDLSGIFVGDYENEKSMCLIVVYEILNEFPKGFNGNFEMKRKFYWQEVKQEIENL
jgi:ribosomal protein S17E